MFFNMGTRKIDLGETGKLVKANLRRLREEEHLSLHELSERLATLGRPILPSGLSKIEQGSRRVDVDDLVALADALRTVPSRLLRGRELPSDFDKKAQHEEIREEAALALRACEKQGFPDTKSLRRWTCLTAWSAHFQRCYRISSATARTL